MSLADLTDSEAINKAIAEFDTVGRDDFLKKYGFGKAVRYYLVSGDKRYDAKAIIGAAHGFQHPDLGPLKSTDFASSEKAVKEKLEGMGFEVATSDDLSGTEFPSSLQGVLEEVLELQPSWTSLNTPEMKRRGLLIRRAGPRLLKEFLPPIGGPPNDLATQGRDGTGRKTRIPWMRVHSRERSPRATEGWYISYLVAGDGSSVWMSLNQGSTFMEGGQYKARAEDYIQQRVDWAKTVLVDHLGPSTRYTQTIDLHDSNLLAQAYEKSHVLGVEYKADSIPPDSELRRDLLELLPLLITLYESEAEKSPSATSRPPKLDDEPSITLSALGARFSEFLDERGVVFDDQTQLDLLASTLSSQILLFAGPSGTGKSTAADCLGRFFAPDDGRRTFEVQREWLGTHDFVGYLSQFTQQFVAGEAYGSLRELASFDSSPPVAILEEANLSPLEGYLAPIIHGLSRGWAESVVWALTTEQAGGQTSALEPIVLAPYPRFLGTLNVDSTAMAPARKVAGRACVLLLEPPSEIVLGQGVEALWGQEAEIEPWGAELLGDPRAELNRLRESDRLTDLTSSLKPLVDALASGLGGNVISHRAEQRIYMYMAVARALAASYDMDDDAALTSAAENGVLHFVLPVLSGSEFQAASTVLVDTASQGGLLQNRLDRLNKAAGEHGRWGVPVDFWSALS